MGGYLQNGAGSVFTQGGAVIVTGTTTVTLGTLTGNTGYTWTTGSFSQGGGAITTNVLRLVLNGVGGTFSAVTTNNLYDVQFITNAIAVNSDMYVSHNVDITLVTATIANAKTIYYYCESTGTFANTGTIAGTGTMSF
jgi:hypothetical protein